jgi:hypothetical protein
MEITELFFGDMVMGPHVRPIKTPKKKSNITV